MYYTELTGIITNEHPHQFIDIHHDIQGLNVTPDAANQI